MNSEWRDGTNCQIFVRPSALPEIMDFLHNNVNEEDFYADKQLEENLVDQDVLTDPHGVPHNSTAKYHTRRLFYLLSGYMVAPPTTDTACRFVAHFVVPSEESILPVVWHNNVNLNLAHRFLLHVLLSMGHFSTEAGLLFDGNIKNAFHRTRLLTSLSNEDSVLAI
jgi:hypothetical protein